VLWSRILRYSVKGEKSGMMNLLLASSKCPKCGKWNFWTYGFDYKTYEHVSWCDDCGYEEREFDQKSKDTFEFLTEAIHLKENKTG